MSEYILWFKEISYQDIARVGGKNASLGEMYQQLVPKGINIPNGFAVTTGAYRYLLGQSGLGEEIKSALKGLDTSDIENLQQRGKKVRRLILHSEMPKVVGEAICGAYRRLCLEFGQENLDVAVRSSATAEDLVEASFAGQQESYLNVTGERELLQACMRCFASLFTDRAISYRVDQGFDHFSVQLSIGVQKMVRSDLACSGVSFSVDTESGFKDVVLITGTYGLGETIVQGQVNPDEYFVFKPTLKQNFKPIISKTLGSKKTMMIYGQRDKAATEVVRVERAKRAKFVLSDEEIIKLSKWMCEIEEHYSKLKGKYTPMDVEWAKDGKTNELFIVQARPETVTSQRDVLKLKQYKLLEKGPLLATGSAIGQGIGQGAAHVSHSATEIEKFKKGEVLVTSSTDPDWEPIMKVAAAVITDHGGRTSHAAIVSRELGIPCVVGTGNATSKIQSGAEITACCAEGDLGRVYEGLLKYEESECDLSKLPVTRTKICLNVGSPDNVFAVSFLPNDGVGLARLEFIISSSIKVHPRALIEFENIEDAEVKREIDRLTVGYDKKQDYFVDKLAQGVGKIAAAFYPKSVIVRMSDFKSNEYAHLVGGNLYEPHEENPMIGWRGASRYYSEGYKDGFGLECQAMLRVREIFGLKNLKLMIPFCRTVEEAKKVIECMAQYGLVQGRDGLEIYGMCEIPSNVLLADEFLDVFDGFSIGSNDLTQLTLGLDRDSELVADLFDERNQAVKKLVREVISVANKKGKYIGICGDAPSTYPDFATFLVEAGIGAISLSADAIVNTRIAIAKEEERLAVKS
ncbi:MAG: phosphoenolpyruvate synthase [Deltaproteobacteria bacterium]|nr:phosphoenolpyruvate synthase [Deltaproteobacteria bacterium]